jgi:lysophospholipase L1-like esterase
MTRRRSPCQSITAGALLPVPRFFPLLLIALSLLAQTTLAAPAIEQGDVVAVCGDSLTEQKVYSVYIEDYLLMCQPIPDVKTLGCGWGGSTAPHFAAHMGGDVMTFSPSVAVICYGMNDGNGNVLNDTIAKSYRTGLEKVIANFQRGRTRTIIVGSPPVVDSFYFKNARHAEVTAAQYNETLGQLGAIAKEVAAAQKVLFADLHTPMMDAMTKAKRQLGESYPFSSDRDGVHGGPNEHLVMAYAVLKSMGFDGHIGTTTYDASTGQATVTEGHRIVSSEPGKVVTESSRYPFCFFNGTKDAAQDRAPPQSQFAGNWSYGNAAILPFVPFNQELNRYPLVVRNLTSRKARISWGEQSKEFTSAELARGVNLAAEFLKNPFVASFAAVDRAVINKQTFETQFITHFLFDQPGLMKAVPSKAAAFKLIDAGFRDLHAGLLENCRTTIKPVTHTITIEELPAN